MKRFSIKPYLIIIVIIFILSIFSGTIDSLKDPESSRRQIEHFSQFFGSVKDRPAFLIFLFIFLNNVLKGLFAILLFFLFGIYPVSMILTNGVMIGTAAVVFSGSKGFVWFLSAVLPHGLIEIPVFLFTAAIALRLGHLFFKKVVLKEDVIIKEEVNISLLFYLKYLAPLFLLAAFIEVYVTPKIIMLF
jgi:stage II sporulation protein M